ncbi:MAG: FkbM family methyltransferase [Gemmatimonadota bacterium]
MALRMLRYGLRHRVRGASRVTFLLARHLPSLQAVPIPVGDAVVWMDLRTQFAHYYLAAAPCAANFFEPAAMDAFASLVRPGDVFFDVGANHGWFSVLAATLGASQIHAFEPQPDVAVLLRRTLAPFDGTVHELALSDQNGAADLFVPDVAVMAGLRDWVTAQGRGMGVRRSSCQTRRLDDLQLPRPDIMKVDVEGAERLVFDGARATLDREDAPIVVFEAASASAAGYHEAQYAARDLLLLFTAPDWTTRYVRADGGWDNRPPHDDALVTVVAVPRARAGRLPML